MDWTDFCQDASNVIKFLTQISYVLPVHGVSNAHSLQKLQAVLLTPLI